MQNHSSTSCFCPNSSGSSNVGVRGAPPAGEAPAAEAAAERPVLHAETSAVKTA